MTTARNRTRAAIAASAVLALAMGVAACGDSSTSSSSGGGSTSASKAPSSGEIKIGAALIGPKNDKSFNQAAYMGIQLAEKNNPNLKLTSTLENRETDQ